MFPKLNKTIDFDSTQKKTQILIPKQNISLDFNSKIKYIARILIQKQNISLVLSLPLS